MKPILITVGDPAGVGPEVALKALAGGAARGWPVVLVGHLEAWRQAADLVGATVRPVADLTPDPSPARGGEADVGAGAASCAPTVGRGQPLWPVWSPDDCRLETAFAPDDPYDERLQERGEAQLSAIEAAVRACLAGEGAAVVTMPIDKRALAAAGSPFPGHTELIADLCGAPRPVMMLFGPTLRVVPLTTHLALAEVPRRLSIGGVLESLRVIHRDLQRLFGLARPRVALCGLNPHAGEGGLFGTEEVRVLAPAVGAARSEGVDVDGPLPADSAFARRERYDVIVCPTHDQALIPLKLLHFDCGVNVTLGLPIVRTSPDHGTARDIAWRGEANPCSAAAAIAAAAAMAERAGA